ncbi:hypothetical protein B0A54_04981 [Friedmanniomyces endolithicus]|uniref:XPG-I domain-containing protein n=1 Tax=Friedmanniomyces endolithicus TaxID=329885 RepID=A0A4U0V669_9PEZI|nr:hypothetical protein LTS09_000443 [Friedmanniomyces endolithicus]TKA44214.1 hypothetical protein B0A54_04981 [Friedmanniomyces endolithicus]
MGIHGLLKELGPPPRHSLAALSAAHYTTHSRPLVLAIDIAIWLFQIQSGKGGSNPALRTFYYRLLRLLSLGIHPLFVFDGPNKPLFKRNKRVGGPGVRVVNVPEFLAKQLLKQFGFPWHVAPGEAEAECALLQREGLADAVLSEDVDTLMFGSRVTYRDYKAEGPVGASKKTPTHVSVYREAETRERSRGIEREGMILVALMSGGDYLPEGIPGCGPKVACAAARAGFGKELCALKGNDMAGLREWKERLEHEIRTNESKFFSQRKTGFQIPEDFPNREVLGYYTHPCVSTPDKLARLRAGLNWEQPIDFAALRVFAGDAFDWRCVGGAKKFIKNLAPALLVRELRRRGEGDGSGQFGGSSGKFGGSSAEGQDGEERSLIQAIHGKRNHAIVDQELEYRISFTPAHFVPIDLSQEDEDDELVPAGGVDEAGIDAENDFASIPPSSAATALAEDDDEDEEGELAKKVRVPKPFDPEKPEKAWVLKTFVQVGCPGLVEDYEASLRDPRAFLGQKRAAKAAVGAESVKIPAKRGLKKTAAGIGGKGAGRGKKKQVEGVAENAITRYAKVTKAGVEREPLKQQTASHSSSQTVLKGAELGGGIGLDDEDLTVVSKFKMPSTQVPAALLEKLGRHEVQGEEIKRRREEEQAYDVVDLSEPTPRAKRPLASGTGVFAAFAARKGGVTRSAESTVGAKPNLCDESEILDLTASPRSLRRPANPATSTAAPVSTAPVAEALTLAKKVKPKTTTKAKHKTKILPTTQQLQHEPPVQRTPPRRKRPSQELSSPAVPTPSTRRTITGYRSPGPRQLLQPVYPQRANPGESEVVNLISSSPAKPFPTLTQQGASRHRDLTPTPPNIRDKFIRSPSFAYPATSSFRRLSAGGEKEGFVEFMPGELPGTVTKRRRKGGLRRWQTAPVRGSDNLFEDVEMDSRERDGVEMTGGDLHGMDLAGCASPSPARFYGSGGYGGGFLIDDPITLADEDVEDDDPDLPSPSTFLLGIGRRVREDDSQPAPIKLFARPRSSHSELPSSYPKSPRTANANPLAAFPPYKPTASALHPVDPSPSDARNTTLSLPPTQTPSLDPPANATAEQKRTLLILRRSLEGAWKEIDADTDTVSTRGSGDLLGRGTLAGGFRKSGVEVLDLTGD